jgi:hypothetical protein
MDGSRHREQRGREINTVTPKQIPFEAWIMKGERLVAT